MLKCSISLVKENLDYDESYPSIMINNFFKASKFKAFRNFCEQNNMNDVDQITADFMMKFSQVDKIGPSRIKIVEDKLAEYGLNIVFREVESKQPIFRIDSYLNKKYLIESYFSKRCFKKFRTFCLNEDIHYLEELTYYDLKKFKELKSVGEVTINKIYQNFQWIKERLDDSNRFVLKTDLKNSSILNVKINQIFELFGFERIEEEQFVLNDFYNVDIRGLNLKRESQEKVIKLLVILDQIKEPGEIIKCFFNELDEYFYKILKYRYINNYTHKIIGKKINKTSVRSRQTLVKIKNEFYDYSTTNRFRESFLFYELKDMRHNKPIFKSSPKSCVK